MIQLAEANQDTAQADYNSASQGITDIQNMINGANVAQLVNLPYTDELIKYGKTQSSMRSFHLWSVDLNTPKFLRVWFHNYFRTKELPLIVTIEYILMSSRITSKVFCAICRGNEL